MKGLARITTYGTGEWEVEKWDPMECRYVQLKGIHRSVNNAKARARALIERRQGMGIFGVWGRSWGGLRLFHVSVRWLGSIGGCLRFGIVVWDWALVWFCTAFTLCFLVTALRSLAVSRETQRHLFGNFIAAVRKAREPNFLVIKFLSRTARAMSKQPTTHSQPLSKESLPKYLDQIRRPDLHTSFFSDLLSPFYIFTYLSSFLSLRL